MNLTSPISPLFGDGEFRKFSPGEIGEVPLHTKEELLRRIANKYDTENVITTFSVIRGEKLRIGGEVQVTMVCKFRCFPKNGKKSFIGREIFRFH